jgi:DMSO/TMAO reductase YedYZ molybdopterin-dependent catalytic subunit
MRPMKAFPQDSSTALVGHSRDDAFRLTIAGLVSRTQQFSLQDLCLNFSERSFDGRQGDRFSAAEKSWQGCSLNEVIEFVGVSGQAHYLEFVRSQSVPQRAFSVPIADLEHQEIGLVWARDGASLSAEDGGPLLALIPGLDGYQPLAGVCRINLVIIPCSAYRGGFSPVLAA